MTTLKKISVLVAMAAAGMGAAHAQSFPSKGPVTLVVPYAQGGVSDVLARDFAAIFARYLGGPVNVENVPGGGGTVAVAKIGKAGADGYTLMFNHIGQVTMPILHRRLSTDIREGMVPVGMVVESPMTVVASAEKAGSGYADLSQWASSQSGEVGIAHAGPGSASHICGVLLANSIKANFKATQFRSSIQAHDDVGSGSIGMMCDMVSSVKNNAKLKPVAVSTAVGDAKFKDLPTMGSLNVGADFTNWYGLYAIKGTPEDTLKSINNALKNTLSDPEFQKRQANTGNVLIADKRLNREGHKEFLDAQYEHWKVIINKSKELLLK